MNTQSSRRAVLKAGLAGAIGAGLAHAQAAGKYRGTLRPSGKRPYLLIGEEQLPAVREKLRRDPSKRIFENYTRGGGSRGGIEPLILLALANSDGTAMQNAGRAFMASLRASKPRGEVIARGDVAQHHLPRPGAQGPRYDFSGLRYVHRLCNNFDFIDSFGVLTAAERNEFREHAVWVVERLMSPEVRAINARHENRRHNFHTDNVVNIATVGLVFPDHPKAKEWLDYALTDLDWQLQHGIEDGAWHENPRYDGAVLRSILPLAYALRRNAGVNFFNHPGLRSMLDWLVKVQTPPDRVYGKWLLDGHASYAVGAEGLGYPREALALGPCSGDGEWVSYWYANVGMAAPAYKDSDPMFAGRLMWAWERAGGPYIAEAHLPLAPLVLMEPDIPAVEQKLKSENMPHIGYTVMRGAANHPDERYLFFDCGPRRTEAWAQHKHRDLNSISLLAFGVPLSLDAGSGNYRTPVHDTWNKATISHNTVMFAGRDQDLEDGKILQFATKEGADYVLGDASRASRVLQFYRHILFVKPDYFVMWDFIRSYVPSEWLLHSPAEEIVRREHSLEFITPWGVQLDAHFVLPEGKLDIWEGEGPFGAATTATQRGAPPFITQKYVKVKNEANRDFLTVLHPRRKSDEALSVRRLGKDEHVLEVKIGAQTDYVMLFPVERQFAGEQGIRMAGRVGVVRQGPRSNELTLLDGKELSFGGRRA